MSLNYHVIGQRIRNYRQQRNLSQNSVAEKIDKSATYISYIEGGIKHPSLETLVDLANLLGVTKPSVSYATKRLRENGFISMDKDGFITLEEPGMEIAQEIYNRHKVLTEFFIRLGVAEGTAREDACLIEHDISEESFQALCHHLKDDMPAEK